VRDETVAHSYADTLFALAERHEGLEAYEAGIEMVARLLDENKKFRLFLETPRIDDDDRKALIRKVFGDALPGELLNFVLITIDKRRQRLLREISRAYHALVDEHDGRTHADVTVARAVDEATQTMIAERLSKLLDKEVIPHMRVKPEILGGVVVRTGDTIYDGSVRRRLDGMRRQLMKARLP
jgi:F-type H+-transporting ATPase subunit delta